MKKASLFFSFIIYSLVLHAQPALTQAEPGKQLPAWQKGFLDIHHINTGRGSAAYCIFPDGTSLLIDAGELSPLDERTFTLRNAPIAPDSSRKPYEWIVEYIKKVNPLGYSTIDYSLITHFHDDHFGAWYPSAPRAGSGNFLLTGITGVGELLSIKNLIDRGFPNYNYPYDIKRLAEKFGGGEIRFEKTMQNYFAFITEKQKRGMKVMQLKAGSKDQLTLLHDASAYPGFYVRNVKSNQWLWKGDGETSYELFPPLDSNDRKTWPDENILSLALTINYGPFVYYTGGDNRGNVSWGDQPWRDTETPISKAIGEVDIATTDHHGNRDAVNEFMVKTLRPRIWIGQTWSSDHPGHEVLLRMTTPYLYDQPRDLFSTNMLEANRLVIGSLIDRSYKSQQGHIVVRVLPGGETYYVIVLDDSKPSIPVKNAYGPYTSKKSKNLTTAKTSAK